MIKRQYFISVEVYKGCDVISKHFRQFFVKSFFRRNPSGVIDYKVESLANEIGTDIENIYVNAFNDLK